MSDKASQREIVQQLRRVRAELDQLQAMIPDHQAQVHRVSADQIRAILQARRRRVRIFGPNLFSDPPWDILLVLYSAKLASEPLTITEMCKVAGVPVTTALRWLTELEKADLTIRTADHRDRRQVLVTLSRRGADLMKRYFTQAPAGEIPI